MARSKEGGHYVDPITISDNFFGNLEKLDKYFVMFDSVTILDTSGIEYIGLAVLQKGLCTSAIPVDELPNWVTQNMPLITAKVSEYGK